MLDRFEATLQPKKSQEKGLKMEEFFASRRHFRKRGQRMAEYIVMWDEAVEKMLEVGIDFVAWGDLA